MRFDWDDCRVFMALAEAGSVRAAGTVLSLSHATVSRRVAALESGIGITLFDRRKGGYVLTQEGDKFYASLIEVRGSLEGAVRDITSSDDSLSGTVRITTNQGLAYMNLAGHMQGLREAYPNINVEIDVENDFTDLRTRQADVAIRSTDSPAEHLVGRRIGRTAYCLYGRYDMTDEQIGDGPIALGYLKRWQHITEESWFMELYPNAVANYSTDDMIMIQLMTRAGVGISRLPCSMGDSDPLLRRLVPYVTDRAYDMWVLTHPEMRKVARVRAVADFLGKALAVERDLLEGERPMDRSAMTNTNNGLQ